ncbi:MAG: hypothetical protein OEV74_03030 [Cyclobacteriaceae bacterium]|jgi:hypothetical protein|nr:hypothetical protein [Cyclobacteriaceae bacterium]MDH4295228.1 hypothetical protein [Cyclobacteriaceae bacterium]MDH5247878.1 hypothetical protein [Cyclobacteriaceae bacterium]
MIRAISFLLIILLGSCTKHKTLFSPLEEQALSVAALKCQNANSMEWLRKIIALSEVDFQYKGSIYAIQCRSGMVFLHQPWINGCFGCNLYTCEGTSLLLTEAEKTEIIAGAKEENLIYTSSR